MTRKPLTPAVRWIIWAALFNSLLVYLFLLKFGNIVPGDKAVDSGLRTIFYVIGFSCAVASMGIKQVVTGLRTPRGERKIPGWIDPAFVVCLAMAETSGILGFVLAMLGHPLKESLPLFVTSFAAFLLAAPVFFYAAEREGAVGGRR